MESTTKVPLLSRGGDAELTVVLGGGGCFVPSMRDLGSLSRTTPAAAVGCFHPSLLRGDLHTALSAYPTRRLVNSFCP